MLQKKNSYYNIKNETKISVKCKMGFSFMNLARLFNLGKYL